MCRRCVTAIVFLISGAITIAGDGVRVDPILFSLPNFGVCFRFSAVLGLNPDGSSNEEFGTQPDLPRAEGKDALETCLAQINR